MSRRVFEKIMAGLKEVLSISKREPIPPSVWHVDKDGRVRTDKDRPVVLKGKG